MDNIERLLTRHEERSSFDIEDAEDLLSSLNMDWTKPNYNNLEIDQAGMTLINKEATPEECNAALDIIDNFRASHNFPLNTMQVWLRRNARDIDPSRIVVQRIKRLYSIRKKLKRMKGLRLSEMQDIGGCRAIVTNVASVDSLNKKYQESRMRHKLAYMNNYIESPKKSGYRGIHLIFEYHSERNTDYNGQRLEIQLRSPLQHAWATAVETVDTFTNQVLKAGGGKEEWKRFFRLVGTAMAIREKRPLVPNTPTDNTSLQNDLRNYKDQIDIIKRLRVYGQALQETKKNLKDARYFLLTLNSRERRLEISGFGEEKTALEELKKIERQAESYIDPVLVSTEDVNSLHHAYPNYFLDIENFIKYLDIFLLQQI